MVRWIKTAGPLLYLASLAIAGAILAATSWQTVTSYRTPYTLDRQFEAGPAVASRVVILVVDGLRADRATELPGMSSLAARGASGNLRTVVPSLSNPARAAISTGAWPEVSGVTNNSTFEPPPIQSIFGNARRQGLQTAAIGTGFWSKAFAAQIDTIHEFSEQLYGGTADDLIAWQESACGNVLDLLEASGADLVAVGLLAGDEAGHNFGGESQGYRDVTSAVDKCLERVVEELGEDTTVVAVSDHGHVQHWGKGGHGGVEPEVVTAPFAMAGPGVRHSEPLEGDIVDIAPTVGALLGLPIPANNQGRILWDALDIPAAHASEIQRIEDEQRQALKAHMPDREASIAALRQGRLLIAVVALAWFLAVAVAAGRGQSVALSAAALAVFAAAYYALFFVFQLGYSISTVVRQEYLNSFFVRDILAAALAFGIAAAFLVRYGVQLKPAALRLGILLSSCFGLLVTATYYQHGLRMEGWMLEIGPGFKAYLHLLAILGVVAGTVAALLIAIAMRRKEPAG